MKAALGLTLLVAGVYLLTASGHLDGQDQEYYYRMARSLAQEKTFSIEPLVYNNTEIAGARGRDGRFYPQYAPGLPVALSPLVILADTIPRANSDFAPRYAWLHQSNSDVIARIFVSYFDVLATALSVGLVVLFLMRLGYSSFVALCISAAFALSTFAWGQARIVNPEPLQTCLFLAAALLVLRGSTKALIIAGCALGFAVLVKITSVVALPMLFLLCGTADLPVWRRPARAVAIITPVLGALAIYAAYNYSRFGGFFDTGYNSSPAATELTGNRMGNPVIGIYGLLFSFGRGIVWYAPPVIAGAIGAVRFYRDKRQMALAFAFFVGLWIAFYSFYKAWDSGWGWGPRYLLPILPFMVAPAAAILARRSHRLAFAALAAIGFLIQIPGALADFMASGHAGMSLFGQTADEHTPEAFVAWRNFHLAGSEIVRHSALVWHGQIDLAWITFRGTDLPKITFALVTFFIASGISLLISTAIPPQSLKPLPHNPTKE